MSDNLSSLSGRWEVTEGLFSVIKDQAQASGTVSLESIKELGSQSLMGEASIMGAASFYDFTRSENKGKKIYTCNGTSCLMANTQNKLNQTLQEEFSTSEIGDMSCLGRCHENSSFHYNGRNYSALSPEGVRKIFNSSSKKEGDNYYVESLLSSPVVLSDFKNLDQVKEIVSTMLSKSPDELLAEIKLSSLRGRGGAGFPVAFKWEACKQSPGAKKYIVCNADEGDPGAFSDRHLLEKHTRTVLLGLMIGGYVVGAAEGIIYVRAEYPESNLITEKIVAEFEKSGLSGEKILGKDFNFTFHIVKGAGSYVCGEETALLSSIEGQRPEVRIRPPYPTTRGLFNCPTVVNNVETLASIPYILTHGGKHFSTIGTNKSKGVKLISLDSQFVRPGIYEIEMGTSLRKLLYDVGKGFKRSCKAIMVGGPLGSVIPLQDETLDRLQVDFESFQNSGFLLGHGSIVGIPQKFPMIDVVRHLFSFAATESCGKCFPCRLGTKKGLELLNSVEKTPMDRAILDDLLETLKLTSLCALGGGLPGPVENILTYFADELKTFFSAGRT